MGETIWKQNPDCRFFLNDRKYLKENERRRKNRMKKWKRILSTALSVLLL